MIWLLACGALPIMTSAIISPSLPGLHEAYRGEQDLDILAKLVLTTPALAIACSAGWAGFMLDRWGRRPVMGMALLLFGCAGIQGLWTQDIFSLMAMRFFFGLGVAGIMTATATLLADRYEGADLRRVLGLQAATMGAWGIMSQVLAGWLAEYSWRGPFLLYAIAFPLLLPLYWLRRSPQHVDPLIDPIPRAAPPRSRMLLLPYFAALAFVAMSLFSLILVHSPFYFRHVISIGPRGTALLISALTAASSLASLGLAVLKRKLGPTPILIGGFLCMTFGLLGIGLAPNKWALIPAMVLSGAGIGSIMPCLSAWVAQSVRMQHRGRFLGLLTTINYLGQFLSPFWSQLILMKTGDRGLFAYAAAIAGGAVGSLFILHFLRLIPQEESLSSSQSAAVLPSPNDLGRVS